MAWEGLAAEFLQVPTVTRAYTAACILTTAAVVSRLGGWGIAVIAGRVEVSPWLRINPGTRP